MHSPPSVPKSLSLIASDYMVQLRINKAAIQTAPWIPSEFLRMELSTTPRSSYLRVVLLIKSSKKSSSPSPLIMLDARLRDVRPQELMIFLMACMPQSVIALSASCSFSTPRRSPIELERAIIELMPSRNVWRLSVFEFLTFFFSSSSLKIFALSTKQ